MFLIRSIAQARSGQRDAAVATMKELAAAQQKELGFPPSRVLTASIGPHDSTLVMEGEVESIAQFEQQLEAINKWPGMARYAQKFAELFIDGSHRFEIYRIQ